MFVDFRSSDSPEDIHCDLCIVGAGAAGITLACALIDAGIEVCMLESGGFELSEDVQSLYDGASVGLSNASPTGCRLHYFGGTTNHWNGWCAPLREIDFEARPWIANSGWPIRKRELDPWYERAQEYCQIGSLGFDAQAHLDPDRPAPAFDPDKAVIDYFRFSPPTRFGAVYRERLERAANVKVYLHAHTLELETDEGASVVRTARLQTLQGRKGSVTARVFVLACGGMENARLLLLSDRFARGGLGNASGLVGRYFMQHIEGVVANIMAADPEALSRAFSKYSKSGADMRAELSISDAAQRRHGTLNCGFTINAGAVRGEGYKALRGMWSDLKRGRWPDDFGERLWTVLRDLDSLGASIFEDEAFFANLYVRVEPLPNAQSRVSLGKDRDAFGLPRIEVDWRLSPLDKRTIVEGVHRVAEEFGRLELGRIELAPWLLQGDDVWPQPLWGGCHHMGTTRMSDDPATGVVDRDCRLHGVANTYVAGSAVFPTAGYVPPTLTIVALALRLADHLKQRLRRAEMV